MTTRRRVLCALGVGALAHPLAAFAQARASKMARVGVLEATSASSYANLREALIRGLRELGLVEGRNIVIEYAWAEGKYERLPELAAEMVRKKVDIIVASTPPAVQAAQRATTTIPIIMVMTGDPVGSGFVASLSRPGGNITGLSNINVDASTKYLELLRAAIPGVSRVAVLINPGHPRHPDFVERFQALQKTHAVTILTARVESASEIDAAFAAMKKAGAGALIVLPDPFFLAQARQIAQLGVQHRLPTLFSNREPVEAGGLMSYGQNVAEHFYRAATYIQKILKGAKPGELPVEQATKIELVINLRTAKAIGLRIPQDVLLRADKVIE